MASAVFYISGHGFGHASRQIEIINALAASAPDLAIVVRTSAPRWLFDRTLRAPIARYHGACDTGVVQIDGLRLDARATIARARDFYRTLDARATQESALLRKAEATLVISDTPPLACAAAARAGVPSVVVANFTWDWIYAAYDEASTDAPALVSTISSAYRQAAEGWRLPMHGGFESIAQIHDVPFVARHARHDPAAVRARLGLPRFRPLLLPSFGGYGIEGLDLSALDCLDEYAVVLTTREEAPAAVAGVCPVSESRLYECGLRYEDLVGAVDVVVTKPGYGIVSDCIANGTAVLYTSRGRFAEYEVMVGQMPRYLQCAFIDQQDLFAGRWRAALKRLDSAAPPAERPATDGAAVIAKMIRERT